MKLFRLLAGSAALFAFAISAKADNIVINGDFAPTNYTFPGYSAPAGTTTVTGWTLSSASVGGTPYDTAGFYNYDFQAAHPTAGFIQSSGSLTQTLSLIAGQSYTYSFLYEARANYAPTLFTATVGGADLLATTLLTPGRGFLTASGTFIATGTEDLVFASTANGGDGTSVITGVNVSVAPTPEPSSLALLGTGIIGAAGMARRKFARS